MNISLAELFYILAGAIILSVTFASWYLIDQPAEFSAFVAVFIAVMFWSLSFRAYSLAMQGVASRIADSQSDNERTSSEKTSRRKTNRTKTNWKLPLGVLLKVIAIMILTICISKWGKSSIRWFMVSSILHLFLGAFFLALAGPKNNKSK